MATRDVKVVVRAEISSFKRDMAVAASAARKAAKEAEASGVKAQSGIGKLSQIAGKHEKAWKTTSTALVAGGAAIVGTLGLAAKAAMDWESAWTGVLKTVDGSPKQLAAVEDGLRGLARTLPSSHTEIAAVAEAAGQLGVKTDDVVGFTKTMIDLGQSTNLAAEEAATSIARFSNVMGTSNKDAGKLGAALVGLGNNYATTESEIMAMGMRLSGAAHQIKLSEGETLGLAAAMSSVGIEAEAGGTAMSLTMKRIGKAVDGGSDSVALFASTAGMSAEQFSTMWKDDAAGALEAFVVGLGNAEQAGESVNAILTELGITGIRESDALLRLSAAGDLMGKAMKQGAHEYEAGTALIEEANKRYETTQSKIKIALNDIKDAGIDLGAVMLPAIAGIAEGAGNLATAFGSIPPSMQGFLVSTAGVVGVSALAAGGLMKLTSGALETVGGLRALSKEFPRAGGIIKGAAKGIGIATVALIAMNAAIAIFNANQPEAKGMGQFELEATKMANSAKEVDAAFKNIEFGKGDKFAGEINGIGDAIKALNPEWYNLNQHISSFGADVLHIDNGTAKLKAQFEGIDGALADMVSSGNADQAAEAMRNIERSAKEQGVPLDRLTAMFPQYGDALAGASAESDEAATKAKLLGAAMGSAVPITEDMAKALAEVGLSADGTVTSLGKYLDALLAAGLATMSSREASFKWAESLRNTKKEVDEIAKSQGKLGAVLNKGKDDFNRNTDSGLAGLQLFQGKLQEGIQVAQTYAADTSKSQADVTRQLQSTYDAAVKVAEGFGIPKKAAQDLARETLGIPKDVSIKTWFDETAKDMANDLTGALDAMPTSKDIKVFVSDDGTAKLTQAQIDAILGQTVGVEVTDEGTVLTVQGKIDGVTDGDARLLVSDDGTVSVVQGKINGVKDGSATVNVSDGGTVAAVQAKINSIYGGKVEVKTYSTTYRQLVDLQTIGKGGSSGSSGAGKGPLKRATGGPVFGAGTATSDSIPALLSNGEHVITADEVKKMGGHDAVERMRGMAKGGLLAFASGGRVSASSRASGEAQALRSDVASLKSYLRDEKAQEKAAQRSYDRIDGKKENKSAKAAAKRRLNAAKAAVKRTEAQIDKAQKSLQDTKAKAARLSEEQFGLARDLKRGTITESFTSGSGMSIVDRLFDMSKNKDLSAGKRSALRATAYKMESELLKLEKRADSLGNSMEKATKKRDDLLSARDSVAGKLRDEFSLGGLLGDLKSGDARGPLSAGSFVTSAWGKADKIRKFGEMLGKLRGKGYSAAVVQEIAELGSVEGTQVGNALMGATTAERKSLNHAYKSMDYWSGNAGTEVTKSMYKGGLDAAQGLVNGLLSKEKAVESATYKLGKAAEKGFRTALDTHSPSRVLFKAGVDTGEGAEQGILSKVSDVQRAMGYLTEVPAGGAWGTPVVPPSREVSAHAAGAGADMAAAVGAAVHDAMASYRPMVELDGRQFYGVMQDVTKSVGKRR